MTPQEKDTLGENFRRNLTFICRYFESISYICRRIGMNRQQFNKYLSGKSFPSRKTMRRLCDYFGVEETEFVMDPGEFTELVRLRAPHEQRRIAELPHFPHVQRLMERSRGSLERYVGYYYRYFYSYGYPGYIVKSLMAIFQVDGFYYSKNIGHFHIPDDTGQERVWFRYLGTVLHIQDRIYALEYEDRLQDMVAETILYPAYRTHRNFLSGVQCTLAGSRSRTPSAGRVVFEYLGRYIDALNALRHCGLFPENSESIPKYILERIDNRTKGQDYVLSALE